MLRENIIDKIPQCQLRRVKLRYGQANDKLFSSCVGRLYAGLFDWTLGPSNPQLLTVLIKEKNIFIFD